MNFQRKDRSSSPSPDSQLQYSVGSGELFLGRAVTGAMPNMAAMVTPEHHARDITSALKPSLLEKHSHLIVSEDMLSTSAITNRPTTAILSPRPELVQAAGFQNQQSQPYGSGGGTDSFPRVHTPVRLNKFVRRLHDMLKAEKESGIVEWRRGLLVLHSTDEFAHSVLPKYFKTKNFKTFRRQLNYYGFVHVRSFSTTGSATTALWVNRTLANEGSDDIASVLMLKRVDPCETAKTAEGRRQRKEQAMHTVEEDIGVSPKSLQLEQIRSMAVKGHGHMIPSTTNAHSPLLHANQDRDFVAYKRVSDSDTDEVSEDGESVSAASVLLMLSKAYQ